MKVPCIEISKEEWKYIKPILEGFGYKTSRISNGFSGKVLLVLNVDDNLGDCEIFYSSENIIDKYNRYLVNDREEFLEIAQELINGFCKKKKFTLNDIKPGMIVEYRNGSRAIVFKIKSELYFLNEYYWIGSYSYNEDLIRGDKETTLDIVAVYNPSDMTTLGEVFNDDHLELIWKRPRTIREVSKEAIKKAFDVKPDEELVITE